jgi:hypothetical protein
MVAIAEVLGNRQGNERSVPCCEQVVSIEMEIKCISHNVIKHNCHGIEFNLKLVELKGSSWLEMKQNAQQRDRNERKISTYITVHVNQTLRE